MAIEGAYMRRPWPGNFWELKVLPVSGELGCCQGKLHDHFSKLGILFSFFSNDVLFGRLDVGCGDDGDDGDVHDEHANQEPACGWCDRPDIMVVIVMMVVITLMNTRSRGRARPDMEWNNYSALPGQVALPGQFSWTQDDCTAKMIISASYVTVASWFYIQAPSWLYNNNNLFFL